jgi:hypothetical protein
VTGKPLGKSPFGRPKRRWEDNIKMDARKVHYGVRRMELVKDFVQLRDLLLEALNLLLLLP